MDDKGVSQIKAAEEYLYNRRIGYSAIKKISKKDLKRLIWLNSYFWEKVKTING